MRRRRSVLALALATGKGAPKGAAVALVAEFQIDPVHILETADGEAFTPPKYGVRRLGPARIIADTPGGGGWGNPKDRPREAVLRDIRDGVLTPAAAKRDYGVG